MTIHVNYESISLTLTLKLPHPHSYICIFVPKKYKRFKKKDDSSGSKDLVSMKDLLTNQLHKEIATTYGSHTTKATEGWGGSGNYMENHGERERVVLLTETKASSHSSMQIQANVKASKGGNDAGGDMRTKRTYVAVVECAHDFGPATKYTGFLTYQMLWSFPHGHVDYDNKTFDMSNESTNAPQQIYDRNVRYISAHVHRAMGLPSPHFWVVRLCAQLHAFISSFIFFVIPILFPYAVNVRTIQVGDDDVRYDTRTLQTYYRSINAAYAANSGNSSDGNSTSSRNSVYTHFSEDFRMALNDLYVRTPTSSANQMHSAKGIMDKAAVGIDGDHNINVRRHIQHVQGVDTVLFPVALLQVGKLKVCLHYCYCLM